MNRQVAEEFSSVVRRLSEDLLSQEFEKRLLHGLSSLFDPYRIAYVRQQENDSRPGIYVSEFSEGTDRVEIMSEADFTERYGFRFSDAVSAETSLVKDLSEDGARIVISFQTGDYHSLILMTSVKNTMYLSDEHLIFIDSVIELLLNARYAIKGEVKTGDRDLERVIGSSHRVQGSLSSILMALEMLSEEEFTDEDRDHLKRLAYKGIDEVKALIHEGFPGSSVGGDIQN